MIPGKVVFFAKHDDELFAKYHCENYESNGDDDHNHDE